MYILLIYTYRDRFLKQRMFYVFCNVLEIFVDLNITYLKNGLRNTDECPINRNSLDDLSISFLTVIIKYLLYSDNAA